MTAVPYAVVQRAEAMMAVLQAEESLSEVSRLKMALGTIDRPLALSLMAQWNEALGIQAPPKRRVTAADLLAKRPRGMKLIRVLKRG